MAAANEIVLEFGRLKIYRSQHEIGKEIVKKFDSRVALTHHHPTKYINVIIVGPAFTDLRDQTIKDIKEWQENTNWYGSLNVKVVNSSSLEKGTEEFLDCFEHETGNAERLHIVIHDEAHWGVREASQINKFLKKLNQLQGELKRQLFILCVSATIYILKDIKLFHNQEEYIVDWTNLRRQTSPEPRFEAPDYLAWEDNEIVLDLKLKNVRSAKDASAYIVKEYIEAMNHLFNNSVEMKKHSISMRVLQGLLKDNEPCMVVIRLASITDASCLQSQFVLKNTTFEKKIYIIQYFDEHLSIKEQLNAQGLMVLPRVASDQNVEKKDEEDWSLNDLIQISCVVIVVDKLKMGERIPNTTKFYDLRSCYPPKKFGSKASWIQDVGRCAGHNKTKANVFVGIDPRNEDNFRVNDRNLKNKGNKVSPATPVAQFSIEVYETLKPHIIILIAEPQIGKTGAVIAMLQILIEKLRDYASISLHQSNDGQNQPDVVMEESETLPIEEMECSSVVNGNHELQATSTNHDNLKKMTTLWAQMANENFVLFEETSQSELFKTYHDKLKVERKDWPDKNPLIGFINQSLSTIIRALSDEEPLKIADCGCGLHGLFSLLLRRYNKSDWNKRTIIDGFDVGRSIVNLQQDHDIITFNPKPGDMAPPCEGNDYHLIMYGHSLYEVNITRHINWAYNNIQNSDFSCLIIWDVVNRFPIDFVERMESFGFKRMSSQKLLWFTFYVFYKVESLRRCSNNDLIELFLYEGK